MKILLFSFWFFNAAFATTLVLDSSGDYSLVDTEFKVVDMIQDYARLKNFNLIMDEGPSDKIFLFGSKTIKKENIDLYISAVVAEVGYTILQDKELNQIRVIPSRDIRYNGRALYTDISHVPDDYNYTMFSMRLKHALARDITRNMRPFMSRYGRIIEERNSNTLILLDTGKNVRRLYELISSVDNEKFSERVRFLEDLNKEGKRIVEKKISTLDFVRDQHVLFIIVFSMITGILGFGVRGYLMKRIEGGR